MSTGAARGWRPPRALVSLAAAWAVAAILWLTDPQTRTSTGAALGVSLWITSTLVVAVPAAHRAARRTRSRLRRSVCGVALGTTLLWVAAVPVVAFELARAWFGPPPPVIPPGIGGIDGLAYLGAAEELVFLLWIWLIVAGSLAAAQSALLLLWAAWQRVPASRGPAPSTVR